ncbi:MAG: MoaD/ThiS family protein [Pseudomonadota bacterium]
MVFIPTPLLSYTGARQVNADGTSVDAVLRDLDRQFQGIRFRMIDEQDNIRPHIRIFIDGTQEFDLRRPLAGTEDIVIVQALSGG